jgi:membrane-associated phospholipid phosphatase
MTDDEQQRRREAFIRRNRVARQQLLQATFRSDENIDNDPVTNFGKALNHDGDGIPTEAAHRSLVGALEDGSVGAFNDIVGADGEGELRRRLIEPHGSLEFQKSGVDPHMPRIRPHPSFSSEQTGAEMVELYWRALCRDVQYGEYGSDGTVGSAVTELGGLSGYNGPGSDADPRISNGLDHSNLFRGIVPGTQKGLRISQFLWKDIPRGAIPLSQRIQVTRHIIKGRDLAQKVRRQVPYLSIRDAAEILLGMGVPYDPNIPYQRGAETSATDSTDGIRTGKPFINFGSHDILDVVVNVFISGQNVCWYRKWQVHRRLRPEEYGGRIHAHKERDRSFPIPDNVLDSTALSTVESTHDSYLLPQAYTEGSPTHPSFPAGHSGVAGATVTVLKAMFDGTHEFTNDEMVVPDADGTTDADLAHGDTATDVQQTKLETIDSVSGGTVAATGSEIDDAANSTVTVNDELNKLAANMALGRNWAGIHYRTDGIDGFLLGEQAAVRYLQDHIRQHDLPFDGYRLEPFFDKYPGTLDDAEPNLHGGQILIKPEEIVNLGGMEGVDDPLE